MYSQFLGNMAGCIYLLFTNSVVYFVNQKWLAIASWTGAIIECAPTIERESIRKIWTKPSKQLIQTLPDWYDFLKLGYAMKGTWSERSWISNGQQHR